MTAFRHFAFVHAAQATVRLITLDANVAATKTRGASLNAALLKQGVTPTTSVAFIQPRSLLTERRSGGYRRTIARQRYFRMSFGGIGPGQLALDAVIAPKLVGNQLATSLNADLLTTKAPTVRLDAFLPTPVTNSLISSLSAILQKTKTDLVNLDAFFGSGQATNLKTAGLSGVLQKTRTDTILAINAILSPNIATNILITSLNALLKTTKTDLVSLDSSLRTTPLPTIMHLNASLDAVVMKPSKHTRKNDPLLDAFLATRAPLSLERLAFVSAENRTVSATR